MEQHAVADGRAVDAERIEQRVGKGVHESGAFAGDYRAVAHDGLGRVFAGVNLVAYGGVNRKAAVFEQTRFGERKRCGAERADQAAAFSGGAEKAKNRAAAPVRVDGAVAAGQNDEIGKRRDFFQRAVCRYGYVCVAGHDSAFHADGFGFYAAAAENIENGQGFAFLKAGARRTSAVFMRVILSVCG